MPSSGASLGNFRAKGQNTMKLTGVFRPKFPKIGKKA
jgi:hypothetical protein